MKERIKQLMESLHMTQQEFALKTQIGAATLSNIYNDRTRPTLNVVELIKKNIPNISTDWLLMGIGEMYVNEAKNPDESSAAISNSHTSVGSDPQSQMLQFDEYPAPTPRGVSQPRLTEEPVRMQDKKPRRVTEIRVYYDDQTWESFVSSKSK